MTKKEVPIFQLADLVEKSYKLMPQFDVYGQIKQASESPNPIMMISLFTDDNVLSDGKSKTFHFAIMKQQAQDYIKIHPTAPA